MDDDYPAPPLSLAFTHCATCGQLLKPIHGTLLGVQPHDCHADATGESSSLDTQKQPSAPDALPLLTESEGSPADLRWPFRHTGWRSNREAVYLAMCEADLSVSRRRAFAQCGTSYWLQRSNAEPNLLRLIPDHCHDRFCLPCQKARAHQIAVNVGAFAKGRDVRLITLTQKSADRPLRQSINRLYSDFRKLRATPIWKRAVVGGVAILELTLNPNADAARPLWHPHLHIIAEGNFLAQGVLSNEWLRVTTDSRVVDIRKIYDPDKAAGYVAKYAAKSVDSDVLQYPELLAELIADLHGKRLVLPFGTWQHANLLAKPSNEAWRTLGHINDPARWMAELEWYERDAVAIAYKTASDLGTSVAFTLRGRDPPEIIAEPPRSTTRRP